MNENGSLFVEFLNEKEKEEIPVIVRIATNRRVMNAVKSPVCRGRTMLSDADTPCRCAVDPSTYQSNPACGPRPSNSHSQFHRFLVFTRLVVHTHVLLQCLIRTESVAVLDVSSPLLFMICIRDVQWHYLAPSPCLPCTFYTRNIL